MNTAPALDVSQCRLALFGPVNNGMYMMTKGLRSAGLEAIYVDGRISRAAVDQPVWQDAEFTMSAPEMAAARGWTWAEWDDFCRRQGWVAPPWLVNALQCTASSSAGVPLTRDILSSLAPLVARPIRGIRSQVSAAWADADLLVVSGFEATLLAARSGRPFVVWPHGSDARLAAGMGGPSRRSPIGAARFRAASAALRHAYAQSICIGSHDPRVTTSETGTTRIERVADIRLLALPMDVSPRHPRVERRDRLGRLFTNLGLDVPREEVIALVPSRIHFELKGHDRLFEAISEARAGNIHFVLTGWGSDLERARGLLARSAMSSHVTLLPFAVSKPLIHALLGVVDFAVDQFTLGGYGAAAIEAMSHGCPVLMWIDRAAFEQRGWEPPPVLQARSAADITQWLVRIDTAAVDLEEVASAAQSFVAQVHRPKAVAAQLAAIAGGGN